MNMNSARTQMVDTQIRPSDVVNYRILSAFLNTKREHFLPLSASAKAYGEYEIEIDKDRKAMSPRSLAKLIELAAPKEHEDVLVIGAGLGYETAILSQLSETVIAIESKASLVKDAEQSLADEGFDRAVVMKAPLDKGWSKGAPYDLILFTGAIQCLPKAISDQLKETGRIVAYFEEDGICTARTIYKDRDGLFSRNAFQSYAPALPGFEQKNEFVF